MKELVADDKINLYYFDESGFTTVPCVPYAWQPQGEVIEIPSFRSKRLNILGFMSTQQQLFFHAVEGSVTSEHVIEAFDKFTWSYASEYAVHKKPCIVVIDNASVHTSDVCLAQHDNWAARGVLLHYLPTYSPELNLIEILWAKIKYEWLPLSCYLSYSHLKKAVLDVLAGFGSQYQITFV
jgi:hypothetical protein